jgi:hypothetical protein
MNYELRKLQFTVTPYLAPFCNVRCERASAAMQADYRLDIWIASSLRSSQ